MKTNANELQPQDYFFWNMPGNAGAVAEATVIEVREKAVKINYGSIPAFSKSTVMVFDWCAWVPKSALVLNKQKDGLTLAPWFIRKGLSAVRIKSYFIQKGEKIYC